MDKRCYRLNMAKQIQRLQEHVFSFSVIKPQKRRMAIKCMAMTRRMGKSFRRRPA